MDCAQSISHEKIDVKTLNCDFLVFSGHKMYASTGVGILYGKKNILENMQPFMFGGQMINIVERFSSSYNDVPYKFEAGTPNFVQAVGLGTAIDYINSIGIEKISDHEKNLTKYAMEKLSQINGFNIFGSSMERIGVISFNLDGVHPLDLAQFLNEENIAILATGPLTSEDLFFNIQAFTGIDACHFFDAASPIIYGDTIDHEIVFKASRYDKGDPAYLNCCLLYTSPSPRD